MGTVFIIVNFPHHENTVIWKKITFLEVPFLTAHCCIKVPGCMQHLCSKESRVLVLRKGVISSVTANPDDSTSQKVFSFF